MRGEDVQWYDTCNIEDTTFVRRRRWVRQVSVIIYIETNYVATGIVTSRWVRQAINTALDRRTRADGSAAVDEEQLEDEEQEGEEEELRVTARAQMLFRTSTSRDALSDLLEGRSGTHSHKSNSSIWT